MCMISNKLGFGAVVLSHRHLKLQNMFCIDKEVKHDCTFAPKKLSKLKLLKNLKYKPVAKIIIFSNSVNRVSNS